MPYCHLPPELWAGGAVFFEGPEAEQQVWVLEVLQQVWGPEAEQRVWVLEVEQQALLSPLHAQIQAPVLLSD